MLIKQILKDIFFSCLVVFVSLAKHWGCYIAKLLLVCFCVVGL